MTWLIISRDLRRKPSENQKQETVRDDQALHRSNGSSSSPFPFLSHLSVCSRYRPTLRLREVALDLAASLSPEQATRWLKMVHVSRDWRKRGRERDVGWFVGQQYPTFNGLVRRTEISPGGAARPSIGNFFCTLHG